jgi:uncharacterized protein
MFVVECVLFGNILAYIRLKAKSVIAPSLAHGAYNASGPIAVIGITGGSDLLTGQCGLAGIIVLLLFNIAIALISRNELRNDLQS